MEAKMIHTIRDIKHFEAINNTQFLKETKNKYFADFFFKGKYYMSTL